MNGNVLRREAGARSFGRGEGYFKGGKVLGLAEDQNKPGRTAGKESPRPAGATLDDVRAWLAQHEDVVVTARLRVMKGAAA